MIDVSIPPSEKTLVKNCQNEYFIIMNNSGNWITVFKDDQPIHLRPGSRLEALLPFSGNIQAIGNCDGFPLPKEDSNLLMFDDAEEFMNYCEREGISL